MCQCQCLMLFFLLLPTSTLASLGKCLRGARSLMEAEAINDIEQERIIGGQEAARGMFPYMVAGLNQNQFGCGGTLIAEDLVLTAAHCLPRIGKKRAIPGLTVIVGSVRLSNPQQTLGVAEVALHPDYNDATLENDIALVRLVERVDPGIAQPVTLASAATRISPLFYRSGTIMGFGTVDANYFRKSDPPQASDSLLYAEVCVVYGIACKIHYPKEYNNNLVCTKSLSNRGICVGDSGGPLILKDNNGQDVQLGIASFIKSNTTCGIYTNPGVFTLIPKYENWIRETARDDRITFVKV